MSIQKYTPGQVTPITKKTRIIPYSPTKSVQQPTYTTPVENNTYSLADPADGSLPVRQQNINLDSSTEEVKPKKPSFSQEVMKRVTTSLLFGPIAPILDRLSNTKKGKEVTANLDTVKQYALDKTVNQPKVQKAILETANSTTNVVPAVKAIFGEAFDMGRGQQDTEDVFDRFNRYKTEFDQKASDPNNTFGEDLGYSLAKSGPQTITGVLLGMIPFVGPTASSTYFGTVSAASQIEEEGKVTSPLKIAIDTVGDRLLGNGIESLLKKPSTELVKTGFVHFLKSALKGAGTEGGTEVVQSFLKYSVDYQNAKTDEEKLAVVQKAKDYVMNGGMFLEFTTGAILGGTVGGVAGQYSPEQTNYIPRKTFAKDDDKEFTPAQNEVREKVRNSVATELDNGTDPGVIAKGLSDATGADIQITMQIVNEIQQDIKPEQKQTQDIDIQAIIDEASAVAKQTVEEQQDAPVDGKLPTVDVDMAKIENMADEVLYGATEPVKTPVETPKTVQKEQKSAKEEPVKITTQQAEDVKSMITSLKQEGYSDFETAREIQKKQNLSIDDAIKLVQRYGTQADTIEPTTFLKRSKTLDIKPTQEQAEMTAQGNALKIDYANDKISKEDFETKYKELADRFESSLSKEQLDIINKQSDNKEYERNTTTRRESQKGVRTNDATVSRSSNGELRARFLQRGFKYTSYKKSGNTDAYENIFIPRGSTKADIKSVIEFIAPELNKESIDKIISYSFRMRQDLIVELSNSIDGETDFYAGVKQKDGVVKLYLKLTQIDKIKPQIIDHEIAGHVYYSQKTGTEKSTLFNNFKNEWIKNKGLFNDLVGLNEYWEDTIDKIQRDIRFFTPGINIEESNNILRESGLVDGNNKYIVPTNIIDTTFNFDEISKKIDKALIDRGYSTIEQTAYYNTVMADEVIAYVAENAELFKDSNNNVVAEYANDVVNNTLEFGIQEKFQTKKKVRTKKGFISSQEALEKAMDIPVFKELQARGQVVLSEKLNNPKALASYSKGVIKFINNPHETTLPHEAFHAFADLVLTTDEKATALDLVRESGMGDLQAEEKLAQDFAEWYVGKQKKSALEKIFDKIKAFFNKLVGNRNEIETLFESVLDEKLVRSINSFEKLGGIEALRAEYNQSPEEFTYELFEKSDIWKKPSLKKATIIGALGSLRKPLMKEFVATKLDTDFAGQDVIDTEELRRSIYSDLLEMKIIESNRYADYGLSNIGTTTNSAKTYILNTNFLHGRTGHFSGEFETTITKDDLEIRVIPAGMHQGQRVEKDQYYVTTKNLSAANLLDGTFGKFETRDEAQAYIDGFSDMTHQQPGLFGHFRAFKDSISNDDKGEAFNVVEMQSDVFQDLTPSYFRTNKRLMENELKIVQDDIDRLQKVIDRYRDAIKRQEEKVEFIKEEIETLDKKEPGYKLILQGKQDKIDAFVDVITENQEEIAKKQEYIDRQEKEKDKIIDKYTTKPEGVFFEKQREYNSLKEAVDDLQAVVNGINKDPNKTPIMSFVDSSIRTLRNKDLIGNKLYIQLWSPYTESIQDREVDISNYNSQSLDQLVENGTEYGYRNRQIIKQKLEEIITEAKQNLPTEQEFLKLTPQEEREVKLSEQFISFKNNYYETIINSTIRQAAMEDARVIRFATPYTVANVEGYIVNDEYGETEGSYTEEEIENIGVGGAVEVLGYDGIITKINFDSYEVAYAEKDLSSPIPEDDIIDGERENRWSEFNYNEDLDYVKDKLREKLDDNVSDLTAEEIETNTQIIDKATDIESLENVHRFEEVKEEIIDAYMYDFNAYEFIRGIYGSNGFASYEDRNTTYYIDAGGNDISTETLAFKTSFSGNADEFKLSDIQNDEHRAIAAKYGTEDDGKEGAFLKYIKRKRKDLREVIDDNGFSWYESNITPEDKASVELYQTEDQIEGDDAWQDHEIDIITGDVKSEDLKPVVKNPVFDTGDKVEDVRRTLLFAENRVGVTPQPIRKVTVSGINKVPLPEALQTEALRLELEQESLDISPLKTLQVHENKKEGRLGEVLGRNFDYGKVNKVSEWQRRGDEIVNNGDFMMYADENGFVSTEVVREAYGNWRDKTKRLQEDKKEYKYKVAAFKANVKDSLAMQKLAEQEDKKLLAELDKNAKAEAKRKMQEEKAYMVEQGIANAKAEEFKRQERIRVVNKARTERVPELSKWAKLIGQRLNPLKYTDRTTQNIFKNWNGKILKGSIRADREAQAFTKIPANKSFDVIQKYEAGKDTEYTAQIKQKFDALLKEARERGVEFGFRDNYIPHVYRENTQQIKKAIRKYLKDKGLSEDMINAYENGEQLPEAIVNTLKINPFFSKERVFPSYEVAMKYGLTPKYTSVAQLVGHYIEELETIVANNELIEELSSTGKILPFGEAPLGWLPVQLPPATQGYMANTRVAKVISGLFGDQETVGFWKIGAYISKKMQQIKLSAGVPYTTVNFFAIGAGLIKEITAGNFKAVNAFYRANFNRKSMDWFQENTKYVAMMANQGIDLRKTIDSWEALHSTIKDIKARGGKKSDTPYVMDEEFDRAFSDKTFMAFMPMLQVQLFKDVYNKFIEKGYSPTIAEEFAGKVIVKNFGITEFNARSQKTKDQLSTIFFAPQFREGVINALYNTGASGVDFVKNLGGLRGQLNPEMMQNRKLLAGMIISFALYNLLNAALNDDGDDENGYEFMWNNPKNRQFALQIPTDDGTLVYVEFMPSFLAFARNIFSGTAYLVTGEFDKAQQKFGTLFSMPIKVTTEILANADYFDRPIYKETDTGPQKAKKISKYLGLSVMHPYITETVNQIEDKKPLYQSIITGAELPLKFSTKEKVATGEYYDALDKKAKENARAKEKVMPKYESIKELKDQGKHKQALDEYNKLTDEEKLVYNKIKENPYEKKQEKIAIYEESIESLKTKSLQQVENEIAKTMYGDKPTASQKSTVAKDFGFYKEFNDYKYKIKAEELKGLNNESKILYLKKMKSEMTPAEYQEFLRKGRKMVRLSSGNTSPVLISDEVLKAVR